MESKKMTVARLIELLNRIPLEEWHAEVLASYDGSCESQIWDCENLEVRNVDWMGRPIEIPSVCLPGD